MNLFLGSLVVVVGGLLRLRSCEAAFPCETDKECEKAYLEGSECVDGFCSNPFLKNGGCLKSMLPEWHKIRTCGSEDAPEAASLGYCRPSLFDYMEIRISFENWDTAIFGTWIVQILMAELLDVPVSLEPYTDEDLHMNFYDPLPAMNYGPGTNVSAMQAASEVGDCRVLLGEQGSAAEDYRPCAHVFPEVWMNAIVELTRDKQKEGVLEAPLDLGMMASISWFVPRFTADRHPSVTSYLGLSGEKHRKQLAKIFKRPTTWNQYCQEVSPDKCAGGPDGVATRAPEDEEEGDHYFVDGVFTGFFRDTDENNCTAHPKSCTGHITDYPCSWTSVLPQIVYHNGIALESSGYDVSGGYSYGHMVEIWTAANATRSDVLMTWWWPEVLYQDFIGTDAEFTPVALPRPTQTCLDNRVRGNDVCSEDEMTRVGPPEGNCDYVAQNLKKYVSGHLRELTEDPNTPEALWSPARHAFVNYKLSDLQAGEIFTKWRSRGVDTYGFDARLAACEWVVDNLDLVMSFVPNSYPRTLVDEEMGSSALIRAALGVAAAAITWIAVLGALVCVRRRTQALYHAQVELLYVLLAGWGLVAAGSLLMAIRPTDATCTVVSWLVNLGYAIELAPLAKKVDAINRLANSGKHMQRVRLSRETICIAVALSCGLIGLCLLLPWTIVDTPRVDASYELTESVNSLNETIVVVTHYCASESNLWGAFSIGWQAVVLLYALVLVFMASRVREDMNDTRSLGVLIISQFVFMALRLALTTLHTSVGPTTFTGMMSIFLGADCLLASSFLVLPKACDEGDHHTDEILPDLFLESTILIADVTGFTAWSSVRDPVQVFRFLDTLYQAFDEIADNRRVFKVETVRDSYVAATGIPTAQKDHAVIMAKFATDLMLAMKRLSHELEIQFGPDTSELNLRVGVHSGPVTGGVLMGKGARFQLFGDNVNMAVNIERAGESGRIHVSEQTAALLIQAGKEKWLEERSSAAHIKGKGEVRSYWLKRFASGPSNPAVLPAVAEFSTHSYGADEDIQRLWDQAPHEEVNKAKRKQRLIDWNVEVLHNLLRQIVARRNAGVEKVERYRSRQNLPNGSLRSSDLSESTSVTTATTQTRSTSNLNTSFHSHAAGAARVGNSRSSGSASDNSFEGVFGDTMPLLEVEEIIHLPEFDRRVARHLKDAEKTIIPEQILEELKFLVTAIAAMYNDNPFHSFSHASHVVQAVIKMTDRIVAASELDLGQAKNREKASSCKVAEALHDHTYGITSDPLTRFACVFSALVHDLDHPGVPNPQLIKENALLAATYEYRSVAEQNSFDLAWNLLMDSRFKALRRTICGTQTELWRFRKLVVNSVMATDLGDKELKALRNDRWDKAFKTNNKTSVDEPAVDATNRKATIVIEHIIQAADVSHTMQHWHVYREWNENLFREMYYAYKAGRADRNPADFWYKGEIGFFDFYIIPLSKKLAECGVFGVTSDENLNYAMNNRAEWLSKGQSVVAEMVEKLRAEAAAAEPPQVAEETRIALPESGLMPSEQALPLMKTVEV